MKPSIFFFSKYFRFASEQYPLSVITSCGVCPACWRMASSVRLLFIIAGLRHPLPHNPLQIWFHRNLGVVGLHKPVGPGHDARLRIGEVILHLGLGLGLLLRLALTLGLLSRSLFQGPFRFPDPLQSRLPPRQLRRQFISPPIPSVAYVLFLIRGFGLLH